MKLLFLHPNFPAQFKYVAERAAAENHDVKFLCQTHYGREVKGVDRLKLKEKAGHKELIRLNQPILQRTETLANQYRQGFIALKNSGWNPDIVISHSGWGCGTYVKEVWRKCKQISYLEWWFDPESDFYRYDAENKYLRSISESFEKHWLRNQSLALQLSVSDTIISPTYWQRAQLPESLRNRCHVIFDGIDLSRFNPIENNSKIRENIITYGTRGMDPIRSFPQLIKALPSLLSKNLDLTIEIAGVDEAFYGNPLGPDKQTWGQWAKKYLTAAGVNRQVCWLGRLKPGHYEKWLSTSQCHIYLSHPFVASWSLVESYCCGVPIVASNVKPIHEICNPAEMVEFVDHRNEDFLESAVKRSMQMSGLGNRRLVAEQRQTRRYGLEESWESWKNVSDL